MQIKNYSKFSDLPFCELGEAIQSNKADSDSLIKEFVENTGIKIRALWFLPQLVAHLSNWKVSRGSSHFSAVQLLVDNVKNDPFNLGVYHLCRLRVRGDLVAKQNQEPGLQYCALVPLMLMPFKKLHGIDYSSWDRTELKYLLDPKLLEAINYTYTGNHTPEELLHFRTVGLTTKSGDSAGKVKSAQATYTISGIDEFKEMPLLQQHMRLQTWVAHPVYRHKYMILDPVNLDSMPEALISTEVLVKPNTEHIRLPWE